MAAFYSELDPFAAAWLRELIGEGLIPDGVVDERDIRTIAADDLRGYRSVHLFAGVGGWPLALRLAGWPDDRPVWSGSCPCQPFSSAGKRKGQGDDRHLWPAMFGLVRECRPVVTFGEQVPGAIGHGWLDGVCADLEGEGYAVGSLVLGAHSVGAPHIRQRLYWVADAHGGERGIGEGRDQRADEGAAVGEVRVPDVGGRRQVGGVADCTCGRCGQGRPIAGRGGEGMGAAGLGGCGPEHGSGSGVVGHAPGERRGEAGRTGGPATGSAIVPPDADAVGVVADPGGQRVRAGGHGPDGSPATGVQGSDGERQRVRADAGDGCLPDDAAGVPLGDTGGPGLEGRGLSGRGRVGERLAPASGSDVGWDAFDLIPCRDGKARRVEPGTFPLAHGIPRELGPLLAVLVGMGVDPGRAKRLVRNARGRLAKAGRNRVGRLRGYGNAICPQDGALFARAFLDVTGA